MKKKLVFLLTFAFAFMLCAFAGCQNTATDDSTHTHEYDILKCNETVHWYECECGDSSEIVPHSGGTATCQQAVCCVCQTAYGTFSDHSYTLKYDSEKHWYECACGDIKDEATHSGGTATCQQKAVCSTCEQKYGNFSTEHSYTIRYNVNNHWFECYCGAIKDGAEHSGGTATCQDKAVCSTCKQEYGKPLDHNHSIKYNAQTHWYECVCGDKKYEDAHSGGIATCQEKAVCAVCLQEYGNFGKCEYVDSYCTICNTLNPTYYTEGLRFTRAKDNQSYSVTRYNGSSIEVIIPSIHNNLPVTSIEAHAFDHWKAS